MEISKICRSNKLDLHKSGSTTNTSRKLWRCLQQQKTMMLFTNKHLYFYLEYADAVVRNCACINLPAFISIIIMLQRIQHVCEEKFVMWRNFRFICMTDADAKFLHMRSNFKFFHMKGAEKSEIFPHETFLWCFSDNLWVFYAILSHLCCFFWA